MNKKVIITGVTGMDGSHLVDYLLENTQHELFGIVRRCSKPNYTNLQHNLNNPRLHLVTGDLSDSVSIDNIVKKIQPDYFVNLASQSFVGSSWEIPEQTFDVTAGGVIRTLEAVRKNAPNCRYYNAGSSEEFGDVITCPQDETHPLRPRSPYGAAKAAARLLVKVYRESYNLYAIQGVLFNHEGTRRGLEFVTRKITHGVANIALSYDNYAPIELGNVDSQRDWSDARDFVRGIWMMLNQSKPKEYILASGVARTVKEFVTNAFECVNIVGQWEGKGIEEKFIDKKTGKPLVVINPAFYRPAEVEFLCGDSSLARKEMGWEPQISFNQMIKEMVENDLALTQKQK
jgi:GDPmannose 4,6-dehydratase